jgi:mRNA interferase RelE/StbE
LASVQVLLSPEGQADLDRLPVTIHARVEGIIARLAEYPNVSGAKPLKGEWAGHFRIRTGDWRVVFQVIEPNVIIVRIMHRSKVYED